MKARTFLSLTSLVLALTLAAPVQAITVCYDYVYYRITTLDDRQRLGPGDVLTVMAGKGYKELTGQQKPGLDGTRLQAGDVIVMPGHIGYANGPNNIDHYVQCIPIKSTSLVGSNDVTAHPPGRLPTLLLGKTCRLGGFFTNATLRDFLEATTRPNMSKPRAEDVSYQVWRKAKSVSQEFKVTPGQWHSTGIRIKQGQPFRITATGKVTRPGDQEWGPGGYYLMGYRAYTLKAMIGAKLFDIGAGGGGQSPVDGELRLGITWTYEKIQPTDASLQGAFTATITVEGGNGNGAGGAAKVTTPALRSGAYRADVVSGGRSYSSTWTLSIVGNQITGRSEWECCPGRRVDALSGYINGDRVRIERDCRGQGHNVECHQVYTGTINGNLVTGSFSGAGATANATWKFHLR